MIIQILVLYYCIAQRYSGILYKESIMRFFKPSWLAILISASLFSETIYASAFQLYELGTPIIGTAGVGQAALATDASTSYFNPAGMGVLNNSQFMLGSQLLLPYTNFSSNTATTISGDNGGNAATLTPGMSLYYTYRYSPDITLGVSMTTPYGGTLNYNDGWIGRFVVQNVLFYTINLNPSLSYRINNWAWIGGGVSLEYMKLHETVALPIPLLPDGQATIDVANYAPGFNAGILLMPFASTKIGIAYRSEIKHNLHGDTTFLRINATPNSSTTMIMPQNVMMSMTHDINQFTLLGELGWSNWSSMQNTILTVENYSAVTPRNWRDTYRIGIGGQYHMNPCFLLQTGIAYDSSPTNTANRLPDIPMDRQIRVGAGIMYKLVKHVMLGMSYEYLNLGNAHIDDTSSNGVLSGSYSRNYANTLQVSLNIDL